MKMTWANILRGGVLATMCCLTTAYPKDYESAHRVEPGDVISADVINELFDAIAEARRTITADDLLGTWRGTAYRHLEDQQNLRNLGILSDAWKSNSVPPHLLTLTNIILQFSVSNGHYVLQTSNPDPFLTCRTNARTYSFAVENGTLFGLPSSYVVDRISKDRLRLTSGDASFSTTTLITLDRMNTPPNKPHLHTATCVGLNVMLTWQDNSDDEIGFLIMRKDTLTGVYSNACMVSSNVTSTTNTAPSSGTYWYRVAASNQYGESTGSNVKRVIVPQE